ncbi:type II toxin-antitoxin system RelE/ParE family toxin [Shinella sp.]|uniref:type II toxin-antitoxin system RelE/ParE family toxin n=1 Tax=Shinella sp. TaxID=1870904 RepID=UPI004036403F
MSKAIVQVALGQADDLGGGVFKKRLNDNMHRSIVLAKAGEFWVFAYLFAKKDRVNIDDELLALRKLAGLYRGKAKADLEAELEIGALLEIDHGN